MLPLESSLSNQESDVESGQSQSLVKTSVGMYVMEQEMSVCGEIRGSSRTVPWERNQQLTVMPVLGGLEQSLVSD